MRAHEFEKYPKIVGPDFIVDYIHTLHTGPFNLDPEDEEGLYQWIYRFDEYLLEDISILSLGLGPSSNIYQFKVDQYSKLTSDAPPIVVAGDSGWIMDGYHRANAADIQGKDTIKGYIGK